MHEDETDEYRRFRDTLLELTSVSKQVPACQFFVSHMAASLKQSTGNMSHTVAPAIAEKLTAQELGIGVRHFVPGSTGFGTATSAL